jgi:hypothetical protein
MILGTGEILPPSAIVYLHCGTKKLMKLGKNYSSNDFGFAVLDTDCNARNYALLQNLFRSIPFLVDRQEEKISYRSIDIER